MTDVCDSGSTFCEPLNIMCSNRCANPVRPGRSFFEPTWYHTATCANRRGVILGQNHAQPVWQRQELILKFGWMDSCTERDGHSHKEDQRPNGFRQAPRLSQIND
jgi:hypothetical protein